MKLIAGIVTFNPEIDRLKKNIDSITKQVDEIIIVDNNSKNISEIESLTGDNITIKKNSENYGIAKALNQILEFSMDKKYEWLLFLDQDSISDKELIKSYEKYMNIKNAAMLCPVIIDENKEKYEKNLEKIKKGTIECDFTITSGSLLNLTYINRIGFFDEKLFIDLVDHDFCKRIVINNLKIIRVLNAILYHEVGKAEALKIKRTYINQFGERDKKPFYRTNHSSFRQYYMARNEIIVAKKYSRYFNKNKNILKGCIISFTRLIIEKNKINNFKAIFKGILDGLKYNVTPYERDDKS